MAHKYLQGVVPAVSPAAAREIGLGLESEAAAAVEAFERSMEGFEFHKALSAVWEFIGRMNKAVDVTAPWELAKKPATRPQLEAVMVQLLEGLRVIAGLLYPVMPGTAETMVRHLGLDPEAPFYALEGLRRWNGIPAGTRLQKSVALLPRIEPDREPSPAPAEAVSPRPPFKPEIGIEEFARADLRVARVLSAEAVPGARKLLRLEIDLGETRTIVAGIAERYRPESLIGKQVVVVANLKPAKIRGVVSNGMLLAAVDENGPVLATLDTDSPPGTPLR